MKLSSKQLHAIFAKKQVKEQNPKSIFKEVKLELPKVPKFKKLKTYFKKV